MALCLGTEGAGKTLLLRKLQGNQKIDSTSTCVPTVGTNIFKIENTIVDVNKKKTKRTGPAGEQLTSNNNNNRRSIDVRELGGIMSPLWPKYFHADIKKVLYVVDASDLCRIGAACVLLYTVVAHPNLKNAQVLVVLSKMDASYRQMRNEALLMLQMNRLQRECRNINKEIRTVETSALSGENLQEISNWLLSNNNN